MVTEAVVGTGDIDLVLICVTYLVLGVLLTLVFNLGNKAHPSVPAAVLPGRPS